MLLTQLGKHILTQVKSGKLISNSDWPKDITIESEITTNLKKLSSYTNAKKNKKEGHSGREFEVTYFFFIDSLYASEPVSGSYTQVRFSHSFNAIPEYKGKNLRFKVKIDNKTHLSKYYDSEKFDRDIVFGRFVSFHTHPFYKIQNQKGTYSFFSPADLASLVFGSSYIVGLIAGSQLWLACKTSSPIRPSPEELNSISLKEPEGINAMEKEIKFKLSYTNIAFFSGSLGSKLKRLT